MTADIQKLIDDITSSISPPAKAPVRHRDAAPLPHFNIWKETRKLGPQFRRELSYARKLARSVRFKRMHLIFLQIIWAPLEKTTLLESRLRKQKLRLKKITREMEFGWLDAAQKKVDPGHRHRCKFYGIGVKSYQSRHHRLGVCSRGKTYIFWDNW